MQVFERPLRSGVVAALALASLLAGPAHAGDQDWHKSLEDGVSAAKRSGKPILVVTAWKSGI